MFLSLPIHADETSSKEDSKSGETKVIKGKITRVIDGDSVVLKSDSDEETIHLDGIDAPEFMQTNGDKSTSYLKKLVMEKNVEVRWEKKDSFDRILGTLYIGDKNVNLEMVSKGWAWHFERYNKSDQLAQAQKDAKEAKLGLWEDDNPEAPWDYRKKQSKR